MLTLNFRSLCARNISFATFYQDSRRVKVVRTVDLVDNRAGKRPRFSKKTLRFLGFQVV